MNLAPTSSFTLRSRDQWLSLGFSLGLTILKWRWIKRWMSLFDVITMLRSAQVLLPLWHQEKKKLRQWFIVLWSITRMIADSPQRELIGSSISDLQMKAWWCHFDHLLAMRIIVAAASFQGFFLNREIFCTPMNITSAKPMNDNWEWR